MKTPRVNDFDPDAKVPSLKSSMENMPAIVKPKMTTQPPPLPSASPVPSQSKQQPINKVAQPSASPSKTQSRPYLRRTFDFFEDQIVYLKKEALREQMAGKEGSMNAMMRDAVDEYIKKRTSKK